MDGRPIYTKMAPTFDLLVWMRHLMSFTPLKTKTAEEVAYQLIDIFCDKGTPHILQSDNGREFSN